MLEKKKTNKVEVKTTKHAINNAIYSNEVRLIGDNIENSGEVCSTSQAIKLAKSLFLDLVEVSPNVNPPICKIVDYQKYLYLEEKKLKDMKKVQKENNKPLKEIQLTPNIGVADIQTKTNHVRAFLKDNHKVKLVMKFKGRELPNSLVRAEAILLDIMNNLIDVAKSESLPKLNGKMMIVVLNPKK